MITHWNIVKLGNFRKQLPTQNKQILPPHWLMETTNGTTVGKVIYTGAAPTT